MCVIFELVEAKHIRQCDTTFSNCFFGDRQGIAFGDEYAVWLNDGVFKIRSSMLDRLRCFLSTLGWYFVMWIKRSFLALARFRSLWNTYKWKILMKITNTENLEKYLKIKNLRVSKKQLFSSVHQVFPKRMISSSINCLKEMLPLRRDPTYSLFPRLTVPSVTIKKVKNIIESIWCACFIPKVYFPVFVEWVLHLRQKARKDRCCNENKCSKLILRNFTLQYQHAYLLCSNKWVIFILCMIDPVI